MKSAAAAALLASSLLSTGASLAADTADMEKVANGFFAAYATFHPSDGIPDAAGRAKYAPFISPALDLLLSKGAGAEAAFARENKGSPPLIEGDLFTSNFEGASSYRIGACIAEAKGAHCTVALTYDDGKGKPLAWSDTVYLVSTPDGWRVDDIGYGASWAFANKGRLSDTVRQAIANATD